MNGINEIEMKYARQFAGRLTGFPRASTLNWLNLDIQKMREN